MAPELVGTARHVGRRAHLVLVDELHGRVAPALHPHRLGKGKIRIMKCIEILGNILNRSLKFKSKITLHILLKNKDLKMQNYITYITKKKDLDKYGNIIQNILLSG